MMVLKETRKRTKTGLIGKRVTFGYAGRQLIVPARKGDFKRMEERNREESGLRAVQDSMELEQYRGRLRALLKDNALSEEQKLTEMERPVWELIRLLQGKNFMTAKGLTYCYGVKGNEIFVSRKNKSITRSTVRLSLKSLIALRQQGREVAGPKMLGTFGASYLYPVFDYMGLLRE